MLKKFSERRLAENELIFRQANEKIQKDMKKLHAMAAKEDNPKLYTHDSKIHFYCECSNEKCHRRIVLSYSEYEALHQNRSQFILIPGHNVPKVERVMIRQPEYEVVEKYVVPPIKSTKLHKTDFNKA